MTLTTPFIAACSTTPRRRFLYPVARNVFGMGRTLPRLMATPHYTCSPHKVLVERTGLEPAVPSLFLSESAFLAAIPYSPPTTYQGECEPGLVGVSIFGRPNHLRPFRHPWKLWWLGVIADRAGHSGPAAASFPVTPRLVGMVLADPAAIITILALFHHSLLSPRLHWWRAFLFRTLRKGTALVSGRTASNVDDPDQNNLHQSLCSDCNR